MSPGTASERRSPISDYARIARAIAFITARVEHQPTLEEVAAHVHLSPYHFQRLFCRWAGVTPKRFLQVLTLERAKRLLSASSSLLEASADVGLSSGSRLYDHFVRLEAVTPGEFKRGGEGMRIEYGVHETPFGEAFIGITSRGICSLEFLDGGDATGPLGALRKAWPCAGMQENALRTSALVRQAFASATGRPLSLHVAGTNFQVNVWKALLRIPPGRVTSYSAIAAAIGRPGAGRAVGQAVGDNPVAFLIPCHRVIRQTGGIGGYHWGEARKHAIHAWETARLEESAGDGGG